MNFNFREAEARQTIELAYKTMEAEFKVRENLASQLESDVNDLRFTLHHEREARLNQVCPFLQFYFKDLFICNYNLGKLYFVFGSFCKMLSEGKWLFNDILPTVPEKSATDLIRASAETSGEC